MRGIIEIISELDADRKLTGEETDIDLIMEEINDGL